MNQNEKLDKVCNDFSKLNDDQQDYILGIMNALIFAKSTAEKDEYETEHKADGK